MTENTISINRQESAQTPESLLSSPAENNGSVQGNDWHSYDERESDNVQARENSDSSEDTTKEAEEEFELTVYGQDIKVTKEQAKAAAQKGMAFEYMKGQLADARNNLHLKALDNIARISGSTVNHIVSEMNRNALLQQLISEYGSIDAAPHSAVAKTMREIALADEALEQYSNADAKTDWSSQLRDFLADNPGHTTIPDQVIEKARECGSLALAYSDHNASLLKAELEKTKLELELLKSEMETSKGATPSAGSIASTGEYQDDSFYQMMKSTW